MPKLIHAAFGVQGSGRGEVATSRSFLVLRERLQSSPQNVAL